MTNSVDPTIIDPVTINILIVGDRRISFEEEVIVDERKYSLSLMVKALNESSGPLLRFRTTRAYRKARISDGLDSNGTGADYKDFRFENDQVVAGYDEAWLFGDHFRLFSTELKNDEIEVVSRLMGRRMGGIFATGDHQSLGAAMNASLPRIGTMRAWDSKSPPFSSDSAARHDTKRVTATGRSTENDAIPQTIDVIRYKALKSSPYPHPLLCGPRGEIEVLPDHMHEGNCPDLVLGALLESEYPARHGIRMPPLVIARSHSFALDGPTGEFGAIGAYDGHPVGIGRVVVDASFHHFLNQNLTGFIASPDASPYENFKAYFRNIAVWLCPPEKQRAIFNAALLEACRFLNMSPPTAAMIGSAISSPETNKPLFLDLGRKAREFIAETTTRCFAFLWSVEALKKLTNNIPEFRLYYPWFPENVVPSESPLVDSTVDEDAVDLLIGGVMIKLLSLPPPVALTDETFEEGGELGLRVPRA